MRPAVRLAVTVLLVLASGDLGAAEPAREAVEAGLHPLDWVVIALYAASTIALGWWFSRRQKSTTEYFLGSGRMNPLLIGVSLFASLLSTITYLSVPGEVAAKGPVFLCSYLAYPLVFLVVGFVLLPVYMRQHVTSAYELLEERLGVGIRLLGAGMFLVLRIVWMSLLVFLTATAIATMIGADAKWIPLIVAVTGLISVAYATLGGLRAVVVTDLMQTILLSGGALLVIVVISFETGGVGWFPTEWVQTWDQQPVFSVDPGVRVTVFGTILSVALWFVCTSGGDQLSVQRFMATEDARAARRAIAMQLAVSAVVGLTLGVAGFALLGYFHNGPGELPPELADGSGGDKLFPHFIAAHLPPVVTGLVMSGLFAAAMSSIDSGVNSITAVVTTDFIDRFRRKSISERHHVWVARGIALGVGVALVTFSSLIGKIPGNIMAVTNKTVGLLTVPIFCLFFFALFVPFARAAGVWAGWVCGVAAAVLVAFSGPIFGFDPTTGYDPVSFQWTGPCALVVNLLVGTLVCLAIPRKDRPAA